MANEKHLEILDQGVEAWNQWRVEAPDTEPDLRDAPLRNADLGNIDLRWAILRGLKLTDGNLAGASIRDADLRGANLSGTDLRGANFRFAQIRWANLSNTDARGTNFSGTSFIQAGLYGANFRSAVLHNTVFADVDLSRTLNLDDCQHYGPSSLDTSTLMKSGDLPENFLRGCGLPDEFIDYLPSLTGDPIQYYSCFISYTEADLEFGKRLHADLQDNGVRCWFAPEDMKTGDRVLRTIDEAIRLRDKLVVILSKQSITRDWIEHEVGKALDEESQRGTDVLFPIRLDDAVMETEFGWAKRIRVAHEPGGRHIGDFRNWKDHDAYQSAFQRLLSDLKRKPGKGDDD